MRKGRGWLVLREVGELERDLACAARAEGFIQSEATWPRVCLAGAQTNVWVLVCGTVEAAKGAGAGRRDTFFGVAVQPYYKEKGEGRAAATKAHTDARRPRQRAPGRADQKGPGVDAGGPAGGSLLGVTGSASCRVRSLRTSVTIEYK
jgi:hypothetical protein